ncbi:glycosyltransferase family 1 protein [Campylobacter sp. RM12327]|uniref:glycosyltransferase family protein n=1 Tax=Campylobacter sputorum TaxID=206 RepID=UPI000B79050A|nr:MULTISPECIES: glycosyltransferase [Campylobacter]ASM40008.1 glycosyltransferase [Campylobacter sputorum]MBE7357662.1 glycosyltransferase family 1 protein [Campylobacter sp. RM11302]MBF6669307.1 glycosyltransferase family 1 protein [Campylobacter sp. RM12327]MBF6674576.1 glycosyltransferase family 1 protein [Campylobacter sp. RM13538]MBF6676681.1 glycosyltransferase family 1 protein [Campylobacter sp. RM12321]
MRIVHCGIFNEYDDGNFFYGLERKISHGLHQNGHFVYDFSYRDWERNLRFCKLKNTGLKKMQNKLIEICKNLNADLLLLGKAEKISRETLQKIKEALPNIKIIQWYADLRNIDDNDFNKIHFLDAFFMTNGKNLKEISKKYTNTLVSFIPNISDKAFDIKLTQEKIYDVLYIGNDYSQNRKKFIKNLNEMCQKNDIKIKIYGSLGNNFIFGNDFFKAVAKSKIAVNFNADDFVDKLNEDKILYASDRMAQFMGAGICTFSPKISGFERLFEDQKEIVYFENLNDCGEKILQILKSKKWREIGENGREKALKIANAKRVTNFMLEVLFGREFSQNYEWREFIYKNGENI